MRDRAELARRAIDSSLATRERLDTDFKRPICIYDACDSLGVPVRSIDDASLEGMYASGGTIRPTILVSALRPRPRKTFSTAHELGHHVLRHGSTIDELTDAAGIDTFDPHEFSADVFASYLLMPKVGVVNAFVRRQWDVSTPTPQQVLTVASEFGVGYQTLANHLGPGLGAISRTTVEQLCKESLVKTRRTIVGEPLCKDPLVLIDSDSAAQTVDLEVGELLLAPTGTAVDRESLVVLRQVARGIVFRAVSPGLTRAAGSASGWNGIVRVSRHQYVGLSRYRHLEEVEGDL